MCHKYVSAGSHRCLHTYLLILFGVQNGCKFLSVVVFLLDLHLIILNLGSFLLLLVDLLGAIHLTWGLVTRVMNLIELLKKVSLLLLLVDLAIWGLKLVIFIV